MEIINGCVQIVSVSFPHSLRYRRHYQIATVPAIVILATAPTAMVIVSVQLVSTMKINSWEIDKYFHLRKCQQPHDFRSLVQNWISFLPVQEKCKFFLSMSSVYIYFSCLTLFRSIILNLFFFCKVVKCTIGFCKNVVSKRFIFCYVKRMSWKSIVLNEFV